MIIIMIIIKNTCTESQRFFFILYRMPRDNIGQFKIIMLSLVLSQGMILKFIKLKKDVFP